MTSSRLLSRRFCALQRYSNHHSNNRLFIATRFIHCDVHVTCSRNLSLNGNNNKCTNGYAFAYHRQSKRLFASFNDGTEMSPEQRYALHWREQQKGKALDWNSMWTYIGILAPLFAFAMISFQTAVLIKKRWADQRQSDEEAAQSITTRPKALKIENLRDLNQMNHMVHTQIERESTPEQPSLESS